MISEPEPTEVTPTSRPPNAPTRIVGTTWIFGSLSVRPSVLLSCRTVRSV